LEFADREQQSYRPPERVLGGPVAMNFLLAQSETAAVQVQHLTAYPTGFEFQVIVHAVCTEEVDIWDPMFGLAGLRGRPGALPAEPPEEQLYLSVVYSDGSRADNVSSAGSPSVSRSLYSGRGGASRAEDGTLWTADSTLWVHPLPPRGDVTFACSWPKYGITDARRAIDARILLEAAELAVPILPRKPGDPTFRHAY
jgi:hypothetical protein